MRMSAALRLFLKAFVFALALVLFAASSAAVLLRGGVDVQSITWCGVLALLTVAGLSDMRSRTVPTWVIAVMIALWAVTVWFIPCGTEPGAVGRAFARFVGSDTTAVVLDGFVAGIVVGGGMLLLSVLVEVHTGRGSFGGGDIKLLFAVSLFLGLPASLTMLLAACILAVAFALLSRPFFPDGIAGHELNEPLFRMTIPLAPPIALAVAAQFVFGPLSLF